MASLTFRRWGPLILIWIPFVAYTINYFTGELGDATTAIGNWSTIVLLFTLLTATGTYLIRTLATINSLAREKKVGEDLLLEVGTLALFAAIIVITAIRGMGSDEFGWIESYLYIPAEAVAYGFGPLYVSSAAYRTWRIRSTETAILVICFLLTMIRGSPIFGVIDWIMEPGIWLGTTLVKGPFRVLNIGAGIGILVMIFRALRGRHAVLE